MVLNTFEILNTNTYSGSTYALRDILGCKPFGFVSINAYKLYLWYAALRLCK